MARVDVGLPIPLPSGGYLNEEYASQASPIDPSLIYSSPVQTGINDAIEARAMNPVMMWLASQGIDVAAEKTGVKDVLRDRAAGLLDLFGLGEAQAAETAPMPPVQTGFAPAPAPQAITYPSEVRKGFTPELVQALPAASGRAPELIMSQEVPQNAPITYSNVEFAPRDVTTVDLTKDPEVTSTARKLIEMGATSIPDAGAKAQQEFQAIQDPQSPINEPPKGGFLDSLKDFFGDEERMASLAIAFNSMRLNPDPNLAAAMEKRIERAGTRRQANRTADMLLERGLITPTQAELLRSGQIKASDVFGGTDKFSRILEMMKTEEGMEQLQQLSKLGALGGVNLQVGGQTMTPGREAVDKEYAKEYVQWTQSGGADMAGQLAQIQTVLDKLQSGEQLTGPTIGMAPDFYLYLTNPEAIDARQRVEEVVQRNLRVVLGAQFTEKEGERLISRAYDPKLPPEQNAARLRRLFQQMQSAVEQRNEMAAYFEQNGTLAGYKGKRPSFDDFYKAIEGGTRESLKPGDVVNGWIFVGGDPANETSWKKQGAE